MKRTPFRRWPCPIARTVDLVGDWWTPLVLNEAFRGARRFEEFQQRLSIGRNVLSQRLRRLVDEGVLERVKYQDRPERHQYVLTAKGRALFPILATMAHWGDTWLPDPGSPPVVMRHQGCGQSTHPVLVCAECGEPLRPGEVARAPALPYEGTTVGHLPTATRSPAEQEIADSRARYGGDGEAELGG